jgi:hypothetical protein
MLNLGFEGSHPHHEEFIEIVAENGAELGLLQQGVCSSRAWASTR